MSTFLRATHARRVPSRSNVTLSWHSTNKVQDNDDDDDSVESSRCSSLGDPLSTSNNQSNNQEEEEEDEERKENAVELIQLICDQSEPALLDLMGLRVSGSRSAGVFVQSVQCGSVVDKNGRIQPGDQLLQVESICLIGLTPDQVVRVLRSSFACSSKPMVRLLIAHSWATKSQRKFRPLTPRNGKILQPSRSVGSLTDVVNKIDIHVINESIILHNQPDQEISISTPPGFLDLDTVSCASSNSTKPMMANLRQHSQGAMKIRKADKETENIQTIEIHHDKRVFEKKNETLKKSRENSAVKENKNGKKNTLRKSSKVIDSNQNDQNDNRKTHHIPSSLPNTFEQSAAVLVRRKISTVTWSKHDSEWSRSRSVDEMIDTNHSSSGHSFPNFYKDTHEDSVDTLTSIATLEDDVLKNGQVKRKFTKKMMLTQIQLTSHAKPIAHEETNERDDVPLVELDQTNATSSPSQNKRSTQSGSSIQSKSSKTSDRSQASQGSQQLSWQCPVCLDGANRIRSTKRKLMSTSCGHVFCNTCVQDFVNKYHACPTCRASISSINDVHPIFM